MPRFIPQAKSPFIDGSLALLWDAVVQKMQDDPVLKSAVRWWQIWDGSQTDREPASIEDFPALSITPKVGQFSWADESRFDGPFILQLSYAVAGTRVRDLMNFWQAIAKSLSPVTGFYSEFQPLGVYNATMTTPGFEPKLVAGGEGISADGVVILSVNVDV